MEQIIPYQARIIVPIKERDEQFIHLQNLIEAKREMLINKQKKLRFITKQNRFLDAVKNDYQNATQPFPDQRIVGGPGTEVWTFKALKSGKTAIEFKYVRPWEKDKAPAETKSVPVVIKEGN